jgi:hypothetical protein
MQLGVDNIRPRHATRADILEAVMSLTSPGLAMNIRGVGHCYSAQ